MSRSNEFGYLPQVNKWGVRREYLLYSSFDYSPIGTTKTKLKNGKTKIYKWKKSKGTKEIEYEKYKNEKDPIRKEELKKEIQAEIKKKMVIN